MKAVFFSIFTMAASVLAGPVGNVQRSNHTGHGHAMTITGLSAAVHSYTSSINSTLAVMGDNVSNDELHEAIDTLIPKLEGLTEAIQTAVKDSAEEGFLDVEDLALLKDTIEDMMSEIIYTVKGVVEAIGLVNGLWVVLKPLFSVLGSLIKMLDSLVDGLQTMSIEDIIRMTLGTISSLLKSLW